MLPAASPPGWQKLAASLEEGSGLPVMEGPHGAPGPTALIPACLTGRVLLLLNNCSSSKLITKIPVPQEALGSQQALLPVACAPAPSELRVGSVAPSRRLAREPAMRDPDPPITPPPLRSSGETRKEAREQGGFADASLGPTSGREDSCSRWECCPPSPRPPPAVTSLYLNPLQDPSPRTRPLPRRDCWRE